jgi:hypothetical protein
MILKFNPIWKEKILKGEKTITVRYGEKYENLKPGDEIILITDNGEFISKAIVKNIYKKKLKDLDEESQKEGISAKQLKKYLKEYYKNITEDSEVFVIEFNLIKK